MKSTKVLREATDPTRVHGVGAIRRMVISATAKAVWTVLGHLLDRTTRETLPAEPFTGIGFYARPPASGKPEAIVLMIGDDSRSPVVVAVRDEKTRQAIVGALAEGETAVYNAASLVLVKADGTIEARSSGGVAVPLATKADLQALVATITAWTPAAGDGGAALRAALMTLFAGPPTWPAGTSKLKGE